MVKQAVGKNDCYGIGEKRKILCQQTHEAKAKMTKF